MRSLVNNFLKGCLVLVPTAATIYVVYWVFVTVDGLLDFGPPGVGLVTTVALITLFGALASSVVGRTLVSAIERVLKSVPLVKLLYSSLKDVLGALIGERRSFDRPVVVSLTETGGKAFGFVTHDDLSAYGLPGHVAVYFPQSINFAGHLLLFPRERVQPLKVDNARFMAFVVSGGVTGQRGESMPPAS
jgi:uncharacterized membrane protein